MIQAIARRRDLIAEVKRALITGLELELEPDEIAEDCPLFGFGLGLDSIDALTLVVAIEDAFRIRVPEEDVQIFRSVNAITDFVDESAGNHAR
jgi:acyl carrier protein